MNFAVSFFPVFLFLLFLVYIDSFKLVKIRDILYSIIAGSFFALAAYFINSFIISRFDISLLLYTRYAAPFIEEILKALFLALLIKKHRVGFMIDGSIMGFAIGAGFSIVENIYYLNAIETTNLFVWIVRGLGTAIMHGGSTSIAAVIIMSHINRTDNHKIRYFINGVAVAVIIHSLYNHFFISPLFSSILIFIMFPLILSAIFQINETYLRKWLEVEFDTEAKLIAMLNRGKFSETRAGLYILSIKTRFPQETIVDLLCFIRIYLELSIRAKSILLIKEAGFDVTRDKSIEEKLKEFTFLQKNIGKTGLMALAPAFRFKSKDLWKINMLK